MKVSIIIPVYNVSDYIERCILSVMNQTYKDIECLIVNDCTPDDSMVKCQELLDSYQGPIRFVTLNHERNRGLSASRNTGTEAASGEYIYYLDSDDDITSDCIACLLEVAESDSKIEMVQGNYMVCDGNNICPYYSGECPPPITGNMKVRKSAHTMRGMNHAAWNKLIRRKFLVDNHIKFREGIIFEDFLWMYYMKKYLTNIRVLSKTTYNYYVRPNSIMTSTKKRVSMENHFLVYHEMLDNLSMGMERIEMEDYVGVFSSHYLVYAKEYPVFNDLHDMYLKLAKRYGAWKVYFILSIAKAMNKMNIGIDTLDNIFAIRWKIIKALRSLLNKKE